MKNKLIEQKSKFIDILTELEKETKKTNQKVTHNLKLLTEKDKEVNCFWCNKCQKLLKPEEPFIKLEIWENAHKHRNEFIAGTLKIYHTKCATKTQALKKSGH